MTPTKRRDPLVAAILAALAAAGCCELRTSQSCIPVETAVCPSREEASEQIDAEEITGDGVYYPERRYVEGDAEYVSPAECCYEIQYTYCYKMNGFGRPYVRGGRAVVARPRPAASPRRRRDRLFAEELPPERRRLLAAAWVERGALEHAAVASFGRFALDLRALGAPDSLVRAALRAIGDEVRHARAAFALAAALGAPGHAPGRLEVDPSLRADLGDFVRRTVLDGCVEETIGVAVLEARASAATDRTLRRALRVFAREEARHADLGFRALAWALGAGGREVRSVAAESLREAVAAHLTRLEDNRSPDGVAAADRVFGELPAAELERVARRAVLERVLPRAAALGLGVPCAA